MHWDFHSFRREGCLASRPRVERYSHRLQQVLTDENKNQNKTHRYPSSSIHLSQRGTQTAIHGRAILFGSNETRSLSLILCITTSAFVLYILPILIYPPITYLLALALALAVITYLPSLRAFFHGTHGWVAEGRDGDSLYYFLWCVFLYVCVCVGGLELLGGRMEVAGWLSLALSTLHGWTD